MKIIALVRSELKRLTATSLARLAFAALMIVPLLYGGMYLWANQNPYAKLDHIPAAIVNDDSGAKDTAGSPVNYGNRVTEQLLKGKDFDWHVVSAKQASKGIRDETYNFVFTIPASFSADLTSAASRDPNEARIDLTTNDTTSYLSSTIADQAGSTIRAAVTQEVSKQAASMLLVGLNDVRSNLGTAANGASRLAAGAQQVQGGLATADSGASSLAAGNARLASGAAGLSSGLSALATATAPLPAQSKQLATGLDTLRSQTTTLPAQSKQLATGLDTLRSQTAGLPAQATQLADGADAVATGVGGIDGIAGAAVRQGQAQSRTLPAQVTQNLRDRGFSDQQIQQIFAAAAPLTSALDTATTTFGSISSISSRLAPASAQVAAGNQAVAAEAPVLAAGIGQAAGGADRLASGTPALATGVAQLAAGADRLSAAAPALTSGIAQAASGASTLASGAASAQTGAATLSSGVSKLHAGAMDLVSGSTTLASGLKEGIGRIPATTAATRDKQAAAIANPVSIHDSSVASAGSYGAGLAPFFISLAAWIGMYALFLIVKPISKRALTAIRAPLRISVAGWLTPALLGLVQMLALFSIVKFALGFPVSNPAGMIGVMVLASVTFAAIIMTLNVWLGSVGQFLGLVLMLIQLVTAGGTFPWQTLPGPLAALHFALPMSYAVDAIRQLMYGGSASAAWSDAGVLGLWLVGALLLSLLAAARMTRRRTLRDLRPSLIG